MLVWSRHLDRAHLKRGTVRTKTNLSRLKRGRLHFGHLRLRSYAFALSFKSYFLGFGERRFGKTFRDPRL
jgi:hypothetical protein